MFYFFTNLQGSQTQQRLSLLPYQFYFFTNLQGSQTKSISRRRADVFYFFTNLQGSQTLSVKMKNNGWFYFFTNLQGSQTSESNNYCDNEFYFFTNLQGSQTRCLSCPSGVSFTSLQTYKVLKPAVCPAPRPEVLLLYKLTRFSNRGCMFLCSTQVLLLYKLTRFSNLKFNEGSRRTIHIGMRCKLFCTGN